MDEQSPVGETIERIVRREGVTPEAATSVTPMEVLYGLHRKGVQVQAARVLEVVSKSREIVPKKKDHRRAGEILGALDRRGTPIGKLDPLIAACALNRNLAVATGNTRHFGYIAGAGFPLRLEDWRQP